MLQLRTANIVNDQRVASPRLSRLHSALVEVLLKQSFRRRFAGGVSHQGQGHRFGGVPLLACTLAVVGFCGIHSRISAQEVRPPEAKPEFGVMRAVLAEGLAEGELEAEPAAVLRSLGEDGKATLFVYPGRLLRAESLKIGFKEANEIQVQITLIRGLPLASGPQGEAIVKGCDEAENGVRELLAIHADGRDRLANGFTVLRAAKKRAWTSLHQGFQHFAEHNGDKFGGFLEESPRVAWNPDSLRCPFDPRTYATRNVGVRLLGPAQTTVFVIPAINYRYYRHANTPEKDWQWGQPFQLNPTQPPMAPLRGGSRYCFLVRNSTKALAPYLKKVEPEEKDYTVPLP